VSQRLADTFTRLRSGGEPGLVTYVTAGDPGYARSRDILLALDRAGADVIELGVPFSEPLADGPVIQRATERALAGGMTLAKTLDLVEELRDQVRAPIVLFTYANPIYRFGIDAYVLGNWDWVYGVDRATPDIMVHITQRLSESLGG